MGEFVHLHLHSEYSLLDGACRISDIPKAAKNAGHDSVAITDHGVMYGAAAFYNACKSEGIKPIIGCEVYVAPASRFDKERADGVIGYHLVLLVKNEIGYKNLTYMVTKAFTEGFYSKPRIDMELLREHSAGLVALSGCIAGYVPKLLLSGEYEKSKAHVLEMRELFGDDNYYLEIQDHGIEQEDTVRQLLARLSEETGVGLVATGDVHYINKTDAENQAILMCIQTGSVITDGRPIGFEKDEYYYKSTEEMRELFGLYKNALSNTVKIAEMCDFDFDFNSRYLPTYTPDNGMNPDEYLKTLTYSGLEKRVSNGQIVFENDSEKNEYIERIEYELSVISSMGFSEYYLVVRDFVNFAKSNGIPVGPGRGSGAGSLVAYLNYITDVDSIKYGLLFERFLNPERVSMPDFDIDFCYNRRDEVIAYVKKRYGEERVSQIIAFATLAARAAVRDVGRALGMPYSQVDEVVSLIPRDLNVTVSGLLDGSVKLKREKETPAYVRRFNEAYNESSDNKRLIDIAIALEGMPRHTQVHAAGVVITDKPVYGYVPLALSKGAVVTQYDMDMISKLGLVKFDFLALRYLTIISDAEKLVRREHPEFDIEKISLDDKETYDFISSGNTDGLFQLESPGMKRLLVNLKPADIEDITAAISLYRPGPMDSIPEYLKNRKDPAGIKYKIPALASILDVTYGCIIYQEQVMSICRELAGYSLGRADIVRRMMAKKKSDEMLREREIFVDGAVRLGHAVDDANELFDKLVSFASYAFNKSHAAAYSIVAYRTAYLKTHYSAQYMAALLTSVLGNIGKTAEYIAQAEKLGVKILSPDINESYTDFTVCEGGIRFGLAAIKNVGPGFIDSIIEERQNGRFLSFEDFAKRMSSRDINKRQVESLIKCGVFDSFGVYRSRLLCAADTIIDEYVAKSRGNSAGQLDMFSAMAEDGGIVLDDFEYPEIDELDFKDLLRLEKECAGIYFSGNLLTYYSHHIEKLNVSPLSDFVIDESTDDDDIPSEQIMGYENNSIVNVVGIVTSKTVKNTKRGERIMFVELDDASATVEVLVFSSLASSSAHLLVEDKAIAVRGRVSIKEGDDIKIVASEIIPLVENKDIAQEYPSFSKSGQNSRGDDKKSEPIKSKPHRLYIKIPDENSEIYKKALLLCSIFEGNTPVIFYDVSQKEYSGKLHVAVEMSDFLLSELKSFCGDEAVVYS